MGSTDKIAAPFEGGRRVYAQAEASQNRAPRMRIAFSAALVALPLAILATVLVLLRYDLAIPWALPIFSAIGSATTAGIVLVAYLIDLVSSKLDHSGL